MHNTNLTNLHPNNNRIVPVECLIHDEPIDDEMPMDDVDDISSDIDDFI
jgi:hypothetical protein